MVKRRSVWRISLVMVALTGCSPSIREWWTEDLRGPRYYGPADDMSAYDGEAEYPFDQQDDADPGTATASTVRPAEADRQAPQRPPATSRAAKPPPVSRAVASLPALAQPLPPAPPLPAMDKPILPPSVASLTGMSEAAVRKALGAPSAETEKGSQKVWRYAGNGCSLEVAFFLDVTRNTYAVLDHKVFAADGRTVSSSACLRPASLRPDTNG